MNFERHQDPKKAMQVGLSDEMKEKIFEDYALKQEEYIDYYFKKDGDEFYAYILIEDVDAEEPEPDEDGYICAPDPIEIEFVWDEEEGEWACC